MTPRMKPFRSMNPVPIGVAFVIFLMVLMVLAFNLGKLPFFGGTVYTAAFSEAGGLKAGNSVRIGGVSVGQVDEVGLAGDHVEVKFTVKGDDVKLGDETTVTIEIATLLGNKYLSLQPAGEGDWDPEKKIPLAQTRSPYDIAPAFQDLTRTVDAIDTAQLATAFDTMAETFQNSPEHVRTMLDGLSRLSETIASRDRQLGELLQHAEGVTGVLSDRRENVASILGDGSQLLQMLDARREVIAQLLDNTAELSRQLTGLVRDNSATMRPMLERLGRVLKVIEDNQKDFDETIRRLFVFTRGQVDATGAGPWFDGAAINATNPITLPGAGTGGAASAAPPETLGDLLGVPELEAAVRGKR